MAATAASAPVKTLRREAGGGSWRVGRLRQRLYRYGLLLYVACSFGPLTCRAASVVLAGDNTYTGATTISAGKLHVALEGT